jgi:hypothetical protein
MRRRSSVLVSDSGRLPDILAHLMECSRIVEGLDELGFLVVLDADC